MSISSVTSSNLLQTGFQRQVEFNTATDSAGNTTNNDRIKAPAAVSASSSGKSGSKAIGGELHFSPEQKAQIDALEKRDREVRDHEASHKAVGGNLASSPSFSLVRGPNGRLYAVAGEVRIDTSPVPGDPEATLRKALIVQRAALAPSQPSNADRRIAATASAIASKARAESARIQTIEASEKRLSANSSSGEVIAEPTSNKITATADKDQNFSIGNRIVESGAISAPFPKGSLVSILA